MFCADRLPLHKHAVAPKVRCRRSALRHPIRSGMTGESLGVAYGLISQDQIDERYAHDMEVQLAFGVCLGYLLLAGPNQAGGWAAREHTTEPPVVASRLSKVKIPM